MILGVRRLAVLAAALAVPMEPAAAQVALVLDPTSGGAGRQVTGRQVVPATCATFTLRWNTATGPVLGTDSGADRLGTVSFVVPQGSVGDHLVVATCRSGAGGETLVGQARFFVGAGATTTGGTSLTIVTTTTVGATSSSRPPGSTTSDTGVTSTSGVNTTSVPPGKTRPPPPPPRDAEECRKQAEEAQAAALVYQPTQQMTVGKRYDVSAVLGLDLADVGSVSLPGTAPTTVTVVGRTGCTIEAKLSGPNFDIEAATASEQSFALTRALSWRWHVTPKIAGGLTLVLTLQPRIGDPGGVRLAGSALTADAVITVDSQPESFWGKVGRWSRDFFGHPAVQYLLLPAGGAGFVSIGAVAWLRRRRAAPS